MKRVLVLAVAMTGLVLPAAANAGTFQGVVIAKSAKRKTIVTAAKNGSVRTVRAPKMFRKIGLGVRVSVRAKKLPDGTFLASRITKIGLGKRARVRGNVVKRSGRTLYLSAGHSVLALGLRGGAGSKLKTGDRVTASATVGRASLFCDDVTPVGFILLRIFQRYSSRALSGSWAPHQLRILKPGFWRISPSGTLTVLRGGTTSPNGPGRYQRTPWRWSSSATACVVFFARSS